MLSDTGKKRGLIVTEIVAERIHQSTDYGYNVEYDRVNNRNKELVMGAYTYLHLYKFPENTLEHVMAFWPWVERSKVKLGPPRRMLIKAAALLLAEIERIDAEEKDTL